MCFVIIHSILLNILCIWILFRQAVKDDAYRDRESLIETLTFI